MTPRLTYDELRAMLPDLEELRPLLDAAIHASTPDPDDTWSGSGELATAGARLVDGAALSFHASTALAAFQSHMRDVYEHVARAVTSAGEGNSVAAATALLHAAALEEGVGRHASASGFADAAYRRVEAAQDTDLAGLALRRKARATRALGWLDESLALYERAAGIARASGDADGLAEATIGSGNVHEQRGRWDEAERSYRQALDVLDGMSPTTPAHWHALLNVHIVLRSRGDVESSREWLDRARETSLGLEDTTSLPFLKNAEGQLFMAGNDPGEAEARFLEALDATRTPFASVTIGLNLAECLLALGRVLDAAEQTREAERTAITGNAGTKLPEVYRMLGRVAATHGNPDAFVLFERSLALTGGDTGHDLERAQTLQAYAEAERAAGRPDAGAELEQRSIALYRRLGVPGMRRRWVDCFDVPIPHHQDSDSSDTQD
ncbi:MAG: tetratricopeptide repeat protein [Gemmatimonadota bacterium]